MHINFFTIIQLSTLLLVSSLGSEGKRMELVLVRKVHAISAMTDLKTFVYFSYLLQVGGFGVLYVIICM